MNKANMSICLSLGLISLLKNEDRGSFNEQEITFAEGFDESMTSEGLRAHVQAGLGIPNSFFRLGSEAYLDMVKEIKAYWSKGNIILKGPTEWMMKNLEVGEPAIYKKERVFLDIPFRGGRKKFIVYHNSGKKDSSGNIIAEKIEWGDPNLSVKNDQYKNSKSFWNRHKCDSEMKMNPKKAGFWACYGPTLFASQLDLQTDMPW